MDSEKPSARQGRTGEEVLAAVPFGLRVGAAAFGRLRWSPGAGVIGFAAVRLATVLVPVAVAVALAGLLAPSASWPVGKKGSPRAGHRGRARRRARRGGRGGHLRGAHRLRRDARPERADPAQRGRSAHLAAVPVRCT
ncbi:hypothetical protein [Amycolatopsis sulphurea]|uniref:hypothetical protein n=1 Tax=Amycolatopsis sulphurea TaxID=76022 RepID=UPI000BF7CA75|nr:hypothetical protein [Amycolatopsis sulphurea]